MKISWKPWINPLRPWCVESEELYRLCHTSAGPDPQPPFWHIRISGQQQWIENLRPVRFLFWEWTAAKYVMFTKRLAYMPYGDGRLVMPMPRPPKMWLSRKSDVLLMKLTWGGRV